MVERMGRVGSNRVQSSTEYALSNIEVLVNMRYDCGLPTACDDHATILQTVDGICG